MISSIFESFANLFRKSKTIEYPFEKLPVSEDNRGLIGYDKENCIFCYKCEKVCPPKAIVFKHVEGQKHKEYSYDSFLCIYCGECVRDCPKPDLALFQTNEKPKVGTLSERKIYNQEESK